MFTTQPEQTAKYPCMFSHAAAAREGQTHAFFPSYSKTKCRTGKQKS